MLLSQLSTTSSTLDIVWRLIVIGIGQGLFQSPNVRAIMSDAPRHVQGEASAILATGRVIGQSLSVALAGAVFAATGGAAAGSLLATSGKTLPAAQVAALQQTFVGGLRAAFIVSAAVAAMGIVTAFVRGREQTDAAR